jgi:RNA polymerase sigma factor (sigma-70 family)
MEKIYDRYGSQLFTCALAVTGCPGLAEDALHEAFCRGFRLAEIPRNLKAYMFRSVRNAAIDQLRKRSRTRSLSEDYIFDSSAGPGELAEQKQFKRRAAETLLKLSENERETIVQHLYADLTFQEIADIRERSIGTVTSWYCPVGKAIGRNEEKNLRDGSRTAEDYGSFPPSYSCWLGGSVCAVCGTGRDVYITVIERAGVNTAKCGKCSDYQGAVGTEPFRLH